MTTVQDSDGKEIQRLLADAVNRLRNVLQDEVIEEATPIEASTAMELALRGIETALGKLKAVTPARKLAAVPRASSASSSLSSASI